jgi:hypothetical protein
MALDKGGLEDGILDALVSMAGEEDPDGKMAQYAADLAAAIDKFVKTGKVETEDGQKPVR